jgi:hypothetical protein
MNYSIFIGITHHISHILSHPDYILYTAKALPTGNCRRIQKAAWYRNIYPFFKEVSDEQNSLGNSFIVDCIRVQRMRDYFQGGQQQVGIDVQPPGRDRLCKRGGDMFQHSMRCQIEIESKLESVVQERWLQGKDYTREQQDRCGLGNSRYSGMDCSYGNRRCYRLMVRVRCG